MANFADINAMTRLSNALFGRGYGHWSEIRTDARLKWCLADIAKGCRTIVIQQLMILYNLDQFDPNEYAKESVAKRGIRQSFTSVADRLSLSPPTSPLNSKGNVTTSKDSTSGCSSQDVVNFMSRMQKSEVARLAFASALVDNSSVDADLTALSDLRVPPEDEIILETLQQEKVIVNTVPSCDRSHLPLLDRFLPRVKSYLHWHASLPLRR